MASNYQSTIDRIKKRIEENRQSQDENKTDSVYQETIDRIRQKVDEDRRTQPETPTGSVYQSTADRIRARMNGEQAVDPRTSYNVPSKEEKQEQERLLDIQVKDFTTKMDILKYGIPSSGEEFEAWASDQQTRARESAKYRQRTNDAAGLVGDSENGPAYSLPDYMPGAKGNPTFKTYPSVPMPVFDVGNGADSTSAEGRTVLFQRIDGAKDRLAELEQQRSFFADFQNDVINQLQHEKDLLMQQGAGTDYQRISEIEKKIEDANKPNPQLEVIDGQISAIEDEIFSMYGSLFGMSDFDALSQYKSTRQKDEDGTLGDFSDELYDYINGDSDAIKKVENPNYVSGQMNDKYLHLRQLTDDEKGLFNYIYSTAGKDAAYAFTDYLTPTLNARVRQGVTKQVQGITEEHPVLGSILSVGMAPMKAISAAGQAVDYLGDGKIDQNAFYNRFAYVPTAIRGTVSEEIEKTLGEHWGPVGSFAYNVGMSMGDFLANTAAGGGNSALAMAFMGSGAAADTVISAKDRGLSDEQALALGVTSAAVEALTEKIQFDELFKFLDIGKDSVVKYIAKNMVSEAGEEAVSSLANHFADILISGDKSEWNQKIQYYMSEEGGGLSENQAFGKAFWEQAATVGLDALGGAISGGTLGSGSALLQTVTTPKAVRDMNRQTLIDSNKSESMKALMEADEKGQIRAAAQFVNAVAADKPAAENAVNAALDYMREQGKAVYTELKRLDAAENELRAGAEEGADISSELVEINKIRRVLQSQLDSIQAADEMIRRNREAIEGARRAHERNEYTDPGNFDPQSYSAAGVEVDYSGMEFDMGDADAVPSAESNGKPQGASVTAETWDGEDLSFLDNEAVERAMKTSEISPDAAADALLDRYGGTARDAALALQSAAQAVNRSKLSDSQKTELRNKLKAIDGVLVNNTIRYVQQRARLLEKNLKGYGVTNVVVDPNLAGFHRAEYKASYNRDTGVVTVSPYLNNDAVLVRSVVHEITHHGSMADNTLIRDGLKLLENAKANHSRILLGDYSEGTYRKAYSGEIADYLRGKDAAAVVKGYMDGGRTLAEATEQATLDYIHEEMVCDFLGEIAAESVKTYTDGAGNRYTVMRGDFLLENRSLIQRIIDAINDFIHRNHRKEAQYQRTADMLRRMLEDATGENVGKGKVAKDTKSDEKTGADVDSPAAEDSKSDEDGVDAEERESNEADDGAAVDVTAGKTADMADDDASDGASDKVGTPGDFAEQNSDELSAENFRWEDEADVDIVGSKRRIGAPISEGDVRFSKDVGEEQITVDDIAVLRTIPRKSISEFSSDEIQKTEKWARKFYRELGVKSPFFRAWFGDWRANDSSSVSVVKHTEAEYKSGKAHNLDMERDISWGGEMKRETINHAVKNKASVNALENIGEIVQNAVYFDSVVSKNTSKTKMPNTAFMHSLYSLYNENGQVHLLKLYVEEALSNNEEYVFSRAYELKDIEKIADVTNGVHSEDGGLTDVTSTINYSIADLFDLVKRYDTTFSPNEPSKVVNADGTPKVMYHGSPNEFTVFDKKRSKPGNLYGRGFYFSDSNTHAGTYGSLYEVYLNVKNPLSPGGTKVTEDQIRTFLEAVAENEDDYSIENYGTYDVEKILGGITSRDAFAVIQDVNATAIGDFVEAIDLFNKVNGTAFDGIITDTETVVFKPEQIKSATDNIGTFDGTNPDIRYAKDVGEAKITASTTDEERTAILETKSIQVPFYDGQADNSISNEKDDLQGGISLVKAALQRIGEEFGVFRNYNIRDIQVKVSFSKRNLKESVSKENDNIQLAKLMPILRDVVENAVGIESHDNRYYYDNMTVSFENLLGAYLDGDYITPVRFGLKHNLSGENILYVIVSQEKIDRKKITAEIVKNPRLQNTADRSSPSTVTYSVSQIIPFVKSKDLLRYFPDGMLDTEQKKIKWEGIAETILRTNEKNDIKYAEFIRSGDLRSAQKMVKAAANANGYTVEAYHGTRGSFNVFSKEHLGSNTHTKTSERWFFASDKETANSYYPYGVMETLYGTEQADKIKNKGNLYHLFLKLDNPLEVDVIDYDYASHRENRDAMMEYSEQADTNGNDSIILYNALDNQLKTSARESTVYMFRESSQAKSAETIVYDDDGNIVPISKRFDRSADDIRYAKDVADLRSTEEKLHAENEYLKRQFMARNGDEWARAVNPEDVRKISREIARDLPGVSAGAVEAEFSRVVNVLQRKITREYSSAARYRDAMEAAKSAAVKLIGETDRITVNDEWLDIRDLKKKLRDTKVYVNDTVTSEIPEWQSVRRELSGALSVVTTDRTALPIDSFYSELTEEYPEYFPAEIKVPQQQLERIIKVAGELKEIRQYNHETLWVDAEDAGGEATAELANNELVQSFANVMLSKYNETAVETLAAQLRREQDENRWDSNSTRNMIAELERSIPSVADAQKSGYDRGFAEGRSKANREEVQRLVDAYVTAAKAASDSIMDIYDRNLNKMRETVEKANREADKAKNRLVHKNERADLASARKAFSKSLYRLYRDLTKPTDKRHIPEGLREAVAGILELFADQKLDNGKTIEPGALRKVSSKSKIGNASQAFAGFDRLEAIVRKNQTSADFCVSDSFVREMADSIARAKAALFDIQTLSKEELQNEIDYYAAFGMDFFAQRELRFLQQCSTTLNMVQKYINDSNRVFLDGKNEFAADMADSVASNLDRRPVKVDQPGGKEIGKNSRPSKLMYDFMTPDTYWGMYGEFGDTIKKSYRRAQNVQASRESEYADYVKSLFDKESGYSTYEKGFNGDLVSITVDGKTFDVTKAQLMQCYVTWKRPVGRRHMKNGGVYFTNRKGEELETRHVVFTDESFNRVMKQLNDEDKRVADAVGKYLSDRCAEWGNDASMYLYGYKKFMDESYFPVIAAKKALPKDWDKVDNYSRLENKGMTKSVREDAKNALVMTNFFDVADSHVRDMAAYAAYAPVNNDVTRIFQMGKSRNAVTSALGKDGEQYLDDFLKNINQNKVRDAEFLNSSVIRRIFTNLYKRQAVSFNISTVMKQPISYIRAWNSIDGKYLLEAFADKSLFPFGETYKQLYNEMVEHSGAAKMKVLGYSDVGFGKSLRSVYDSSYSALGDRYRSGLVRGVMKAYENISDAGMFFAGKADEFTWVRLWKACELEVDATQKGLNSAERMAAVAEKFNQVIGETQVVDTILDTPPIVKSESMNHYTAFMNEPIKTLNSIYTAFDALKTKKDGAGEKMAKALATYAVANLILEPLVTSFFTMFRDEEDEEGLRNTIEKLGNLMIGTKRNGQEWSLMDVFTSNTVSSLYGGVPVISDLIETVFDTIQGFDSSRMETEGLTNVVDATVNLAKFNPDKSTKTLGNLVADAITAYAGFVGLPAATIKRDVLAGVRGLFQLTDNHEAQWEMNKLLYNLNSGSARSQKNFLDIAAHVVREGDEDAYQYIRGDLANVFTSERKGIHVGDMLDYMEDRNAEIQVGSKIWNIELQAGFNLPQFVGGMQVEKLITDVYKATGDTGILPKSPSDNFKVKADAEFSDKLKWNSEKDVDEDSRVVTFKSQADLEEYTEKVGDYAYKTLLCFVNSNAYKALNDEQKAYAIKRVYEYAQIRCKVELYPEYDPNNKAFMGLIRQNASPAQAANVILVNAQKQ